MNAERWDGRLRTLASECSELTWFPRARGDKPRGELPVSGTPPPSTNKLGAKHHNGECHEISHQITEGRRTWTGLHGVTSLVRPLSYLRRLPERN